MRLWILLRTFGRPLIPFGTSLRLDSFQNICEPTEFSFFLCVFHPCRVFVGTLRAWPAISQFSEFWANYFPHIQYTQIVSHIFSGHAQMEIIILFHVSAFKSPPCIFLLKSLQCCLLFKLPWF